MGPINLIWQYESPMERDWIRYLFSDCSVSEVDDGKYEILEQNSIVVMSSRRQVPRRYIARAAATERCMLYHISDESYHGRYGDYLAFDFVFRNFWSSVFEVDRIKVLPLGHTAGMRAPHAARPATDRQHIWCFVGSLKASRPEMVHALRGAYPGFLRTGGAPDTGQTIERASYRDVLQHSVFCPCPMGNVNLETPRFYDALEAGCIPIVETRRTIRYYERLFLEFPVPKVQYWREAPRLIAGLLREPGALDAKQRAIAEWWRAQKRELRTAVTDIIEEGFFHGAGAGKLRQRAKSRARVPGWRQLELLRHHSPGAAIRRARLELRL